MLAVHISLEVILDPVKEERLNEPHLWQPVLNVHRKARHVTHNDGVDPVHIDLAESVVLFVVLKRQVVFAGHK